MRYENRTVLKNKGKVGVVTLPGSFNYGCELQLFAVIHIYRELGYSPEFLVFNRSLSKLHGVVERARGNHDAMPIELLQSPGRRAAFKRFETMIHSVQIEKPQDINLNDYALFSVGSDQVWNPNLIFTSNSGSWLKRACRFAIDPREIEDERDWYFLGFAQPEQRVALAPSFGISELDSFQSKRIRKGLCNFSRLSVREESGAKIIESITGKKAEVICDPTLALPRGEWEEISDSRITPDGPYVLAYLLGEDSDETKSALSCVSEDGQIPIIRLSDRAGIGELDAGPAEFLSLVQHASHVVTDSFHASVFASIFERPLTITHRSGAIGTNQSKMFARLQTLSVSLGIQNKVCILEAPYDAAAHADYEGVADSIEQERNKFMEYLEGCLAPQI